MSRTPTNSSRLQPDHPTAPHYLTVGREFRARARQRANHLRRNGVSLRGIGYTILVLKLGIIGVFLYRIISEGGAALEFDQTFLLFVLAGFVAQLIDGALGMAYGISCTTLLLQFGLPPAIASAAVHSAEVFTTGVSGLSHLYLKNVDRRLFVRLVLPGVLGAVVGAYVLSAVVDGGAIKPYVAGYLLLMGFYLLLRSFRKIRPLKNLRFIAPLGAFGGFMDAVGGGGWGPIVTSNILGQGNPPKETIGTVNTAEFFVAFFSTGVFLFFTGIDSWQVILGLIVGGVAAAPFGALLASRLPPRVLMVMVGIVIMLTSGYTIWKSVV